MWIFRGVAVFKFWANVMFLAKLSGHNPKKMFIWPVASACLRSKFFFFFSNKNRKRESLIFKGFFLGLFSTQRTAFSTQRTAFDDQYFLLYTSLPQCQAKVKPLKWLGGSLWLSPSSTSRPQFCLYGGSFRRGQPKASTSITLSA